jgi:hypothetical protein
MMMPSCNSVIIDSSNRIDLGLYMDETLFPTIDRLKPNRPSEIYVWDNKCAAMDAEWECLPYALDKCENLRKDVGWAEDYMQCMDDRFQACRKGAGCDYRYELAPSNCTTESARLGSAQTKQLVANICDSPEKEYSSYQSYQACIDNVSAWADSGCGNINATQMSGPILNLSPTYR